MGCIEQSRCGAKGPNNPKSNKAKKEYLYKHTQQKNDGGYKEKPENTKMIIKKATVQPKRGY